MHDLAVTLYQPTILGASTGTYNAYWRDTYKRWIEPAIGHKRFDDVRKIDLVNLLNSANSHSVKSKIRRVLLAIVSESEDNGVPLNVTREIVAGLNVGKKPPKTDLRISEQDMSVKLGTCPAEMIAPLFLAMVIGTRRGEIIGVKWSDIKDGLLTIQRQRLKSGSLGLPKGGKVRTYKVSESFVADLEKYGNLDSVWVCTRNGKPWSHSSFGREWAKLGFPKGTGIHQLRHYAATFLANEAGAVKAQKILGHGQMTTTNAYVHEDAVDTESAVRLSTEHFRSVVNEVK